MSRGPIHHRAALRALCPPAGTTAQMYPAELEFTTAHPAPTLSIIHQVTVMPVSDHPYSL